MYCQHCGTKIDNDSARFCPNCGTKLEIEPVQESAEEEVIENIKYVEQHDLTAPEEHSRAQIRHSKKALLWAIAIPIVTLVISAGSGYAYYTDQKAANKSVTSLKEKAEKAALNGKYADALSSLKKAKKVRPTYKILIEDEEKIAKAAQVENSLKEISTSLKTQELEKADSQINKLKITLQTLKGPLFIPLNKKLEEKSTTLAVANIKVEINKLNSVDDLAGKLTALSSLRSAETDEVKRLILAKVAELTTKDAEKQLGEHNFTEAMTTVDKGLEYATNDTKLQSFKDRIKKEQAAFEKAEQARIQKALEVAAQEDLNNHTSAVTVDNLNVYTDEYGDLQMSGDIINHATVPITSIMVYYSIYDANGNLLGTDFTYGDPYYLDPGQNGSFNDYHYGVNQDCTVKITRITWQLN